MSRQFPHLSAHEVGWQQCVSHQHAAVGGQRHAACRRALASHAQPVAVCVLDNVTQPVGGERHQLAAVRLVLEAMVMIGGFLPHDVAAVDAFAFAQRSRRLACAAAIEEEEEEAPEADAAEVLLSGPA